MGGRIKRGVQVGGRERGKGLDEEKGKRKWKRKDIPSILLSTLSTAPEHPPQFILMSKW